MKQDQNCKNDLTFNFAFNSFRDSISRALRSYLFGSLSFILFSHVFFNLFLTVISQLNGCRRTKKTEKVVQNEVQMRQTGQVCAKSSWTTNATLPGQAVFHQFLLCGSHPFIKTQLINFFFRCGLTALVLFALDVLVHVYHFWPQVWYVTCKTTCTKNSLHNWY